MKKKLLFVITQFYKGGAETSLLNLFKLLDPRQYEIDFIILNQEVYTDATSLVELVPKWIQVYDVFGQRSKRRIIDRYIGKVYRRLFHTETYKQEAVKFVKRKKYDAAFSFGEWLSPAFVAQKVVADRKYVWIHIDIDKADFVNREELIKYDDCITGYIFASKSSMNSAISCCPRMKDKAVVVHNFLNRDDILKKSLEEMHLKFEVPFLLSVGNLRPEKNYLRQVKVMKLLAERKISIQWLCIGSTVNEAVYREVRKKIEDYHLEDKFILCGADENPYKYMKNAEAVMVLSDHESWSLVITEAMILGVPVIATRTSGAQEQLNDEETGIITGFEAKDIADRIEKFLNDKGLQQKIRGNLQNTKYREEGLSEFVDLLRG